MEPNNRGSPYEKPLAAGIIVFGVVIGADLDDVLKFTAPPADFFTELVQRWSIYLIALTILLRFYVGFHAHFHVEYVFGAAKRYAQAHRGPRSSFMVDATFGLFYGIVLKLAVHDTFSMLPLAGRPVAWIAGGAVSELWMMNSVVPFFVWLSVLFSTALVWTLVVRLWRKSPEIGDWSHWMWCDAANLIVCIGAIGVMYFQTVSWLFMGALALIHAVIAFVDVSFTIKVIEETEVMPVQRKLAVAA
jgi:hypothetical protein